MQNVSVQLIKNQFSVVTLWPTTTTKMSYISKKITNKVEEVAGMLMAPTDQIFPSETC